jgi:4-amino-4-deoxy-L-arabinose transferase-like glycosyltransferase
MSNKCKEVFVVRRKEAVLLGLVLVVAGLLRVASVFTTLPMAEYTQGGGDTGWFLANGEGIWSGQNSGVSRFGMPYYIEVLPTPPLYLIFVGFFQKILSPENAIIGIKLTQVLMSMGTMLCVGVMAGHIAQDRRAMWIALVVMAIDPAQVIEPRLINTESLYIFLVMCGLWLYWRTVFNKTHFQGRYFGLLGIILGLATLTRAVGVLLPLALAVHLGIVWRVDRRHWLRMSVIFLAVYGMVVLSWTAYVAIRYNRLVVVSTQLMPAIWRGAVTNDSTPQQNDALLINPNDVPEDCERDCKYQVPTQTYVQQTTQVIQSDPLGYVRNRLKELLNAFLQPHTTMILGGESLRELTLRFLRDDLSWEGFLRVVNGEYFWAKLAIYVLQFAGMVLGMWGLWLARNHWRVASIPWVFIAYTALIHVVLLVLPRYIFPTIPAFWMLAPVAVLWLIKSKTPNAKTLVEGKPAIKT